MRPRTWPLRREHAAGLAALVLIGGAIAAPALADQPAGTVATTTTRLDGVPPSSYPGTDAAYSFTWGSGIQSQSIAVTPTWHANQTTQYGLVVQRYVLSDSSGIEANDQAGVSVVIGDPDTLRVSAELLYGAFTKYPTRFNGSLDVTGATGHFKYDAAFAQTGINGSPSAEDHRITTAG